MLNDPSTEQNNILFYIKNNYNIVVDAVAGSGKTTTVLHIAKNNPDKNILLLTYNSRLRYETETKKELLNLTNLYVFTYHAFGYHYYNHSCHTDVGINDVLINDYKSTCNIKFDLFIIDEIQDMTFVYFEFVIKIIRDHHENIDAIQLCILGDKYQSIYEYHGADNRFLTLGKQNFILNQKKWVTLNLSTSFRVTNQIANFVNKCMLGCERINAIKEGDKVDYFITSIFTNNSLPLCDKCFKLTKKINRLYKFWCCKKYTNCKDCLNLINYGIMCEDCSLNYGNICESCNGTLKSFNKISYICQNFDCCSELSCDDCKIFNTTIEKCKYCSLPFICKIIIDLLKIYLPEDIFIISPTIKKGPYIKEIANRISKDYPQYPIYAPTHDDEKLDDEILKNKICFSTFHQVKGLERKVTIVLNFDQSYYKFYAKSENTNICPNVLYVATTRSTEKLIVVHIARNDYLSFLHKENLIEHCNLIPPSLNNNTKIFEDNDIKETNKKYRVTDLTNHMPSEIMVNAYKFIKMNKVHNKEKNISIKSKIKQGNLTELVSDINGVAIPAYYELINTSQMTIYNILFKMTSSKKYDFIKKIVHGINFDTLKTNIPDLLKLACCYCCYRSGFLFKLKQIKYYNWLKQNELNECMERISKYVSSKSIYEYNLSSSILNTTIIGQIDCIDKNIIWEFKCANSIKIENYLQLAIYAYMYETKFILNENKRIYRLMNILDNEIYELEYDKAKIEKLIDALIAFKRNKINKLSNNEFSTKVNEIKIKYFKY